jgi:hypothetical protein
MNRLPNYVLALTGFFTLPNLSMAQSSSYGPGKSLPMPGMKSKYTYPQPPKRQATGPERFVPAFEIPEKPEKYIWKLKANPLATSNGSQDIPVVYFGTTERPSAVGSARAGEEITLEEFRVVGRRNFYKFNWNGAPDSKVVVGSQPEYFIDGMYIEFAGKK